MTRPDPRRAAGVHAERLLAAAQDANEHGDPATASTHLLAAARALEAAGRRSEASMARRVACELAVAAAT